MANIARYTTVTKLGQTFIPLIARAFASNKGQEFLSLCETSLALLQGKGAGSGWDLPAEILACLKFIPDNGVVFDIGANKGEWSRNVHCAKRGAVNLVLFEPQLSCQTEITKNLPPQARLIRSAVGETIGETTLYSPGDLAGNASLYPRKDSFFSSQTFQPQTVEIITIDDFVKSNRIEKVDFMKMDIEGHELSAMKGAKDSIAKGIIAAMSFEFGSGNINSRTYFRDFWDFLQDHGFAVHRILPGGQLYKIQAYYEDLEYYRGVSNFVCVRRG
jgi:FkbM family methyltransferase